MRGCKTGGGQRHLAISTETNVIAGPIISFTYDSNIFRDDRTLVFDTYMIYPATLKSFILFNI